MPFPGNSSRTSTQAISVPNSAFTSTTITEATSVIFSDATAWSVETASQKLPTPSSSDLNKTAASGISATMLRYDIAMPRPRTSPLTGNVLDGATAASLAGGSALPLGLEDLRDDALLGIEELVVHVAPAPELAYLEQLWRRREVDAGRSRYPLDDRPVALGREDPLRLGRIEEVDEGLGLVEVLGLVDGRDRVLDLDRLVGHDVVDVLALLLRQDRLVLVGQQDIALAAGERLQRLPRALVEHGHVVEQLGQVVLGLILALARLELRAVGGHDVPLGAARGERVGLDHLNVVRDQVVPRLDVLGVALANDEHDDRVGHEALVLVLIPALVDQPGIDQARHVRRERELDHVRSQAALDGARLLAR